VPPQLLQQIDLEFLQQVATMLSVIAIAYVTSKNTHITLSEFIETMFENKMIMMTEYQKLTSEYLQELFTVPELWSTFDKQLKGNVKETMH
jgi:GTP-sensing pleiotropic transcriptional regulator CodY